MFNGSIIYYQMKSYDILWDLMILLDTRLLLILLMDVATNVKSQNMKFNSCSHITEALVPMESITINGQSAAIRFYVIPGGEFPFPFLKLTDLFAPPQKRNNQHQHTATFTQGLKYNSKTHHPPWFPRNSTGLPFRAPWRLFLCNPGQLILGAKANPLGNTTM